MARKDARWSWKAANFERSPKEAAEPSLGTELTGHSVTFLVNETGEAFTNHYTLVRPDKGAAWRLDKAWRTNPRGRTVEEWPVK